MMSDNRTERGRERAPGCGSTGTSSCLQVLAGFAPQWVKRGPMQYFGDAFDAKCCGVAARLRCPTSAGRRGAAAALAAASGARAAAARRAAAVSKRPPLSAAQCSEECIYGSTGVLRVLWLSVLPVLPLLLVDHISCRRCPRHHAPCRLQDWPKCLGGAENSNSREPFRG
jgi:hypothetical protein